MLMLVLTMFEGSWNYSMQRQPHDACENFECLKVHHCQSTRLLWDETQKSREGEEEDPADYFD